MSQDYPALQQAIVEQRQLLVWITHIRQRLHSHRRLGLILGAGVSIDAKCPSWEELVSRIAGRLPEAQRSLAAHRASKVPEPYLTQILYHMHRNEIQKSPTPVQLAFRDYQSTATWMELVHEELYRDNARDSFDEIQKKHIYLEELGETCWRSGFTINFNFDDIVDEATISYSQKHNISAPEVIHEPRVETRRNAPVIFHINGLLPRERVRRKSGFLTFTEDAFADVLISPASADAEFAVAKFATTTFLLIGTSLQDNSLKNMLRAGIKRSPGNHHYILYWEKAGSPRSSEEREQLFQVNLEVYNLISIFLTTDQIRDLLQVMNQPDENAFEGTILKLASALSEPFATRRRYYLVGSVASGKSTNLEALRCFTTFEEWSGRTPAIIYQDHSSLNADQRLEVDEWIYGQLRVKNDRMRATGPGIHLMDRGYLDLFAFSQTDGENVAKAGQLRERVRSVTGALEQGHIVFTRADKKTLSERQARRGKLKGPSKQIEYDGGKLVKQGAIIKKIYRPAADSVFDTGLEGPDVVARKIARLLLLGEYRPFDFEARIDEIVGSKGKP